MLGAFGAIQAMISTFKNNRNLLSKRKSHKEQVEQSPYRVSKPLRYREAEAEELARLKEDLKVKRKAEAVKKTTLLVVLCLLAAGVMILMNLQF